MGSVSARWLLSFITLPHHKGNVLVDGEATER